MKLRRTHASRVTALLAFAVAAWLVGAPSTYASNILAHWGYVTDTSTYRLVQGNIRLSGTTPIYDQVHANWLNFCPTLICSQWVQMGLFQGVVNTTLTSPTTGSIFTENVDPCGLSNGGYVPTNLGTYSPASQFFEIYSTTTEGQVTCGDDTQRNGYVFAYYIGSSGPTDFAYMSTTTNIAYAVTELQYPSSPNFGTDYFGCDSSKYCGASATWLYLDVDLSSAHRHKWTDASSDPYSPYWHPPYGNTFHTYYTFATCPQSPSCTE